MGETGQTLTNSSFASAKARREASGRGWAPAVGVAAGVGGLMTLAAGGVRLPVAEARPAATEVPALVVTRMETLPAGGVVKENLRLMDPTPLFMPDAGFMGWRGDAIGPGRGAGGEVSAAFPAALAFPDQRPAREILQPRPPATPLAAADLVSDGNWFRGLARTDGFLGSTEETGPGPGRAGGRVDVYRFSDGRPVATVELRSDPLLDASAWRPVELSVLVEAAGPVAVPAITRSSGVGEVDERVRALAGREALSRLRLRPGLYRLVVGP